MCQNTHASLSVLQKQTHHLVPFSDDKGLLTGPLFSPELCILEEGDTTRAREREAYWIPLLGTQYPLTNCSLNTAHRDGGMRREDRLVERSGKQEGE